MVEGTRVRRELPITLGRLEGKSKRGKPLTVDYVLEYPNQRLAVIEAKAEDEKVSEGVGQAKLYADNLSIRHTYPTSGYGIYAIDMETGKEGEALRYLTPKELWATVCPLADPWCDRFAFISTPDKSGTWSLRFYQEIAVRQVLEALEAGRDRILLSMATGTGKTSIAFQIAWKLFSSRWNLNDGAKARRRRGGRASSSWPTAKIWPIRPSMTSRPSLPSLTTLWHGFGLRRFARRAGCRRIPASSSPSSRSS